MDGLRRCPKDLTIMELSHSELVPFLKEHLPKIWELMISEELTMML
jgi:hypothetical protein